MTNKPLCMESKQAIASSEGRWFFLPVDLFAALIERTFRNAESLDRSQFPDQILGIAFSIEKLPIRSEEHTLNSSH